MKKNNTKIINLAAGPGSGKSTTAAGLFYLMKINSYSVELILEYAKDLTYKGNFEGLKNQKKIFQEQKKRQNVALGQVDYIITDSPLFLSSIYLPDGYKNLTKEEIYKTFNRYNNINFFLSRTKKYIPIGRNQTEDEARNIDSLILSFLEREKIPFFKVIADLNAPEAIFNIIK